MFMLKSLFGKIWSDQDNIELIQLPAGSFYFLSSESSGGTQVCIYDDAVATIRRTSTPHNYQLVVSRAIPKETRQDADNPDGIEEMPFLIDQALEFHASTYQGSPAFVWRDVASASNDQMQFLMNPAKINAVTRSIFEVTFLQCAWERKTGRSHEEATDEDLERLKFVSDQDGTPSDAQGVSDVSAEKDTNISSNAASSVVPKTPKKSSTAEAVHESKSYTPRATRPAPPTESLQSITGSDQPQMVLQATADLYLYDQASGLFMRQEKGVEVKVAEAGRFLYWMVVDGSSAPWLSQAVDSRMNMNFSLENLSAVWNYFDSDRRVYSWLLRFSERNAYLQFQEHFSHLLWETLNEEAWGKASSIDKQYVEQAYEQDVSMTAADPQDQDAHSAPARSLLSPRHTAALSSDEESADEVEAELDPMDEDDDLFEDSQADQPLVPIQPVSDGEKNSQLAVGYKFDRSFVVRGDKIGVFKHTDDDQLEFATSINQISTPGGINFAPSRAMLHEQDSAMVLMDPKNQHSLYRMDLEYGKVVEEWKVHEDVPVRNILPNTKTAQMTADKTLIGTSRNGIFRIDPRLDGVKLVDSQFKLYTSKNDFSAAATDEHGRLAVASNKGDLRLFDKIGKNAKTALPALGDPILGVDVSADGRWVVATCRTYLLLIDTLINEGRYTGSLGFDRAFPADSRPLPRRLQLRPHHVAYMESEVHFTPAHFNVGTEGETSIVTSTGNYVVSWSFSAVKKGNPYAYVLKRYQGTVVRDEYTYGSDQSIVVAFENDVQLAHRAQLHKPTRASLAPNSEVHTTPTQRSQRRITRA
ncbi:tRNA (guanine(9)-N(1))-methyltransferase [Malassezia yamatoensis]|uniref:tRNA (Guanine(9)-N(1))-methyltransferase n=1 Tax=Malassezia yamatoensis TaxID=253288 RepID=A0AAJ5YU37_9BASI|nr:tRNA (guanine(9)-N(1))-methyltransferase [Malassezia yamatoensis]